ncbi:C1 family peptidase [Marinobacterium rhizophilum]|uniref:C1 family peptidase n=1 Tax=Marinobacterium rhizophilum TaxID=420402 RepID=UPI0003808FC6|nr:C1 family peptidase [Marinobacterium rhizophilum]
MPDATAPKLDGFVLNVSEDLRDNRDWFYTPPPIQLKAEQDFPKSLIVRNQASEGACTGFGLAAVINLLNQSRDRDVIVSPRMLYEMARKFDEWPSEDYTGSSCRGAIKGFANMGGCREALWPYEAQKPGELTVAAAKDGRSNTMGAYYRLTRRISDFHAASNQAGAIFCSANVHSGWSQEASRNGVIPYRSDTTGGHAFAIVGYNRNGFWVQNSWGPGWGNNAVALWSYEDWHVNIVDAWVLSLALPTPQIWYMGEPNEGRVAGGVASFCKKPSRGQIAGHFVHIDDGKFHDAGKYWSNLTDVTNTAQKVRKNRKYRHLLLYAHGGLNSPESSASRIAAMRDVFKENGIYPFHFMYDTGILEELKDVIVSRGEREGERVAGLSDLWDKLLERATRPLGRAVWREMKFGASSGFAVDADGAKTLTTFKELLTNENAPQLHIVGHSAGAILMACLLQALESLIPVFRVQTCSLMAPACTTDLFKSHYEPYLKAPKNRFGVNDMAVYNLIDKLEKDDSVGPYRKSLLYLVPRAFEDITPAPIIGMDIYSRNPELLKLKNLNIIYSHDDDIEPRSLSKTHDGFDNDPATLNDILKRVLKDEPTRLFDKTDLECV